MISFHNIAKGSDCMVKFFSVATGLRVEFPAFITSFSDTYSVGWSGEPLYGRMERAPITPAAPVRWDQENRPSSTES